MGSGTYWFKHDFNARIDPKLQHVVMELGMEGMGAYWCLLEMIYEEKGYLLLSRIKSYAFALHCSVDLISRLVNEFELFEKNDYQFWSSRALESIAMMEEKSQKAKDAINVRWNKKNTDVSKSDTSVLRPNYVGNTEKKRREENRNINTNVSAGAMQPAHSSFTKNLKKVFEECSSQFKTDTKENIATAKASAIDFIKKHKPDFIEPYILLWNLYAIENGKPKVQAATDKRKKKFKTRISEESFELIRILAQAKLSTFLSEQSFFTFDWVIENQENYMKVLEGNYCNKQSTPAGARVTIPQPSGIELNILS